MGKKYLDIKENSLESSVYNILHGIQEKKLDPVGKEDGDIDNDGDKDASDKYLAKRRKTISKAIKKDKKEGNAFGKALKDAKDKGEKTFVVSGKTYSVEEETDLDEGTYRIGNMKKSGNFKGKDAEDAIKQAIKKGIKVDREFTVYDRDKREFIYKNDKPAVATKGTYKEEVDLEEASGAEIAKKMKKAGKIFGPKAISQVAKMKKVSRDDLEKMIPDYVSGAEITKLFEEEVDLEEGKMNQMHQMMKDKKSAEQIAKAMKLDLKTVKALMDGYNKMVPESFEIGTEKYLKHTVSSTPGQKAWNETVSKKAASMRETLAKIWEADVGKSPFQKNAKEDLTKGVKGGKTMTGKKVAAVDTSPIIKEKKK
jgi:hypothetical protein